MNRERSAGLRRAMWSVYTHSFFGAPARGEPLVRAGEIPLGEAIGLLLESDDELSFARRARALRRLVSSGFLCLGKEHSALRDHTEKLASSLGLEPSQIAELVTLDIWRALSALRGFMDMLTLNVCVATDGTCVACYHPAENWTRIRATAQFSVDRETVAKRLDPRWELRCSCWPAAGAGTP